MNVIVMDANSLAWLCRLELGTRRAIEWLDESFSIKLTKTVFDEARGNIPSDDDDALRYLENLRRQIDKEIYRYENKFDSHVEGLPIEVRGHGKSIDKGERTAGILALKMSRCSEYPIIFITDDNEAANSIKFIFETEKIGLVEDSFGIVRYIWSRNSKEIPKRSVNITFQDLKNIMSGGTEPTEKLKSAKRKLSEMTKKLN